jgi:hypothetical protein
LVPGSLEVYPIPGYGAMQIGAHTFCHIEDGSNNVALSSLFTCGKRITGMEDNKGDQLWTLIGATRTQCLYEKKEFMNIENTQSQMRKGILEFCILSVIRRGEAYPSDIVEEMRGNNLQILEGTLYPLLTRLKNAEMLTYRWVESNSVLPVNIFR